MTDADKPKFLVESALLTHGLFSLDNAEIRNIWGDHTAMIAYLSRGDIKIERIDEYLAFRSGAADFPRVDGEKLDEAMQKGLSGALTASGTMAVCRKAGIPAAVTSGIGGIAPVKGKALCADLPALVCCSVTLIAAAPKDMMDYTATFEWLRDRDVPVFGAGRPYCDGFLFVRDRAERLDGVFSGQKPERGMLLLNDIPLAERLKVSSWLELAVAEGDREAKRGGYFHPAVNRKLDELSGGESSRSQLRSLLANTRIAQNLTFT